MDKYGLIGYPIGHSFSRQFFAEKFAREGIDATYENYELADIRQLPALLESEPDLRGLNVTIPHKQNVIPLLSRLSEQAQEIGAVNVVRILRTPTGEVELEGHNSDVIGFTNSIKPLLSPDLHKALVLGTGGASHAICYGLTRMGIEWTYVSRRRQSGILSYEDVTPEVIRSVDVIVNCTPVGMYPHVDEAPPLPYKALTPRHLLYDLVYNPEETLFLRRGAEQGATVKNGLEMLHLQAIASWEIWNQKTLPFTI